MRNAIFAAVLCFACLGVWAADWPQYRADAARSGYTPDQLPGKMNLQWVLEPAHAPQPAWVSPDTRMPFDHAYHVAVAEGVLYYGSSADCKIYACDAATGKTRWSFFTNAPVRLAPAVWKGRVYAVSDDGMLYCLSAKDGAVLWSKRGGPRPDMLLGNDRIIARWPARGGVAIRDGILYFAAGIWPSEGIYLYALDPETGTVQWCNDSAGGIEMDQPHPTARAKSGISAQGYLVVSEGRLLIPTGRAVPAVFDLRDGKLQTFGLQANGKAGGAPVVAAGPYFINSGVLFDAQTEEAPARLGTQCVAVTPKLIVYPKEGALMALDRGQLFDTKETVDRKGNATTKTVLRAPVWTIPLPEGASICSFIAAGDTYVAGCEDGRILFVDGAKRKVVRTEEVAGRPLGLAVADGRLYVSTDRGTICCFAKGRGKSRHIKTEVRATPYGRNTEYAKAAEAIIHKSGVTRGYCVDLGCGTGELAYELARKTDLQIYALDPDPKNVRAAREKLDAAGLYGVRVTVHQADLTDTRYPNYFADLVVSGRSVTSSARVFPEKEARRLQRPYGGKLCTFDGGEVTALIRGALPGTGAWTHQYCTPANTCSSTDAVVRGPLQMLWFRDNDFLMPSRHGRGPAPLFYEGRCFVEGMDALRAFDAYNGRTLWEYPLEGILKPYDQEHLVGTAATNSNFCMEGDVVYVREGKRCLRLDAATGKKLSEFPTPALEGESSGIWGYIACEQGILFGSSVNEEHLVNWAYRRSDMRQLFSESKLFFAMDAETGAVKWTYKPVHSIRHNAIAIGQDRVFLIDRPLEASDRLGFDVKAARERGEALPKSDSTDNAVLFALDAQTGKVLWKKDRGVHGTLLALSVERDTLLMTRQHTRFHLNSEVGGLMTAMRASTGERIWHTRSDPQGKASRPMINGDVIYNEPGAWSLLTGERLEFDLQRSYGCGIMASSKNLIVYRSATFGYYDLLADEGTINYGGIRPGCWINAIPVGGLVLAPDATTRCTCSYLIKASVALQPVGG